MQRREMPLDHKAAVGSPQDATSRAATTRVADLMPDT